MNHLSYYGIAVGSLLAIKLLLSLKRRRRPAHSRRRIGGSHLNISVVITVYNESPQMLRTCLLSLLGQTRLPQSVTVVDDHSKTRDAEAICADLHREFAQHGIRLNVIRFPVNRGKRHGLAAGFHAEPDADGYIGVDSDTRLAPDALAELIEPMASSRRVHCVTGLVLANNRAKNLLTRLIDMRYVNAFLGERVAYSRLGSVLCACGSLALYRGWVAHKYLDDFLGQTYLGKPATFGDDRRLTYYCLLEGKSLINPAATAWTDVPERLGHYIRQQIRWGKSFIREGTLLVGQFRVLRAFWWLNLLELVTWVTFTAALITGMVVLAIHPTSWHVLALYPLYVCVASWLRSIHYLRGAGNVPLPDRLFTFACAPLYGLMNLTLLLPLRLWSLATLRSNGWGTRQAGAEIPGTIPAARPPEADTVKLKTLQHREDDTVPLQTLVG